MIDEQSLAGHAVVLGAGTMGGGIAAQLANAGWRVSLLDVAGPGPPGAASRNEAAATGLSRVINARPALLFLPEYAERIAIGNTTDDLDRLRDADWVVEAVAERMDLKQSILAQVEAHAGPHTVVSSNTSGLSLREMAAGRSAGFRSRFLGSHFLNPPRYLKLLEVVPLPETDPTIAAGFVGFAEQVLGHRVVIAKDTPGFISTRIWIQHLVSTIRLAIEQGLSAEEVDTLTGPLLGRPRSGTFRMADLVGLDIVAAIAENQRAALADDPFRDTLRLPEIVARLIADGRVGDKSGAGFYKRDGAALLALDLATGDYRPREECRIPEVDALLKRPLAERLPLLHSARETGWGRFVTAVLDSLAEYVEYAGPIVASDVLAVDNVMRWGFQWELGPYEIDDLRTGSPRWYRGSRAERQVRVFTPRTMGAASAQTGGLRPDLGGAPQAGAASHDADEPAPRAEVWAARTESPEYVTLADLKAAGRTVFETADGALIDLGDGAACLEFRTKMNTLSPPLCKVIDRAVERAESDFAALVIATDGPHFSAGYNLKLLLEAAQSGDWKAIDAMLRAVQSTFLGLKYALVPVVAAVRGYTLGAGCECALHCSAIQAGPELTMGLPELSAGLVPAGGGIKELLARAMEDWDGKADAFPRVEQAFRRLVGSASTSAEEARRLGWLRATDPISRNADRLIYEGKRAALGLAGAGHELPQNKLVWVLGDEAFQRLADWIGQQVTAGEMSEHDGRIAGRIAFVLTGGDVLHMQAVSEEYLLELERDALIALAHEPNSIARMEALLTTGKPLKN